ncbi:hypothetical protein TTHERM_00013250 (macronuclear) [Tetrahymena thermophila SB210]|uniref:Uncharacterized protein n=1 Tax=Tetrahymena thermophila (strain SB210) TaxID=312017 RepID=Q22RR3_TETTS|nr:hypothetical protein TTHERM_00013250 [Tetrahymena thermophila SB210]EAR88059.2 hypothetical protein TTHERM_00013250 [Tetrahymena thermophila SB210]|eukprot:XP_001008304.2 hypothetical protein TTHERM_00013250 [Tetrahymena thermophila SB210]
MEQRNIRYNLKIHYVRSSFGTCYNYFSQMTQLIQLEGLKFSSENLSDLGGKRGVGSFFECCCYVDPQKWTSEQQIHKAIYTILQSRNMFPSRGYEERLKVEQFCKSQSDIMPQTFHTNQFPTTQSTLITQRYPMQDLERYLSAPNPFINQDDFLQESEKETTCDVTSQDILSCIDQNNNNLNYNDSINLFAQTEVSQQNKNDQRGLNSQIDIFSNQQHQNGLIQTQKESNQNAFLDVQESDKSYQDEQKQNPLPSPSSHSSQNKWHPSILKDNTESSIMSQQQDLNLEQSSINQNTEYSALQKNEETNQKIDVSLNKSNDDYISENNSSTQKTQNKLVVAQENIETRAEEEEEEGQEKEKTKSNNFIQTIEINKLVAIEHVQKKKEERQEKEENKSNDIAQAIQNNNSFNDEESEINSQIHLNNTQCHSITSNKLKNTDDSRNLGESKLQEINLSDSDIKYEEQKDHVLNIHQMKTVDMQQEKEQVYNEQTNYQIKMLIKEVNLQKQKNHQLLKEKEKDKDKINILESSATQYIAENCELKQQVIELKQKLAQTEVRDFDQDILSQNIAQLQQINQEKYELMQQQEKSSDIFKDLYIKELEQTLNQARDEILFLRKELSQKNEMSEILKQIQQSLKK